MLLILNATTTQPATNKNRDVASCSGVGDKLLKAKTRYRWRTRSSAIDIVANSNAQNKLKMARYRCEAERSEYLSSVAKVEDGSVAGTTDRSVAMRAPTWFRV